MTLMLSRYTVCLSALFLLDEIDSLSYAETGLNDLRKQFADEDAEEAKKETAGVFPVSVRSFLSIGLELEERQYVSGHFTV